MNKTSHSFLVGKGWILLLFLEMSALLSSAASWKGVPLPTARQVEQWRKQSEQASLRLIELPIALTNSLYLLPSELERYLSDRQIPADDKAAVKSFLRQLKQETDEDLSGRSPLSTPHVFIGTNSVPEGLFLERLVAEDTAPAGLLEWTQSLFSSLKADIPKLMGWSLEWESHPKQPDVFSFVFPFVEFKSMENDLTAHLLQLKRAIGELSPDVQRVIDAALKDEEEPEAPIPENIKKRLIEKLQTSFEARTSFSKKRILMSATFVNDMFRAVTPTLPWKEADPFNPKLENADQQSPQFRAAMNELLQRLSFAILHECGHVVCGDSNALESSEVKCDLWALAQMRHLFDSVDESAIRSVIFPLGKRENFLAALVSDTGERRIRELSKDRDQALVAGMYLCPEIQPVEETFNCLLKAANKFPSQDLESSQAFRDPVLRPKALLRLTRGDVYDRQVALILIRKEQRPSEELKEAVRNLAKDRQIDVIRAALETAEKLSMELPDPADEIVLKFSSDDPKEVSHGRALLEAAWSSFVPSEKLKQSRVHLFKVSVSAYATASMVGQKQMVGFVRRNTAEFERLFEVEHPTLDSVLSNSCRELLEAAKKPKKVP